jgi:hypothetical protein
MSRSRGIGRYREVREGIERNREVQRVKEYGEVQGGRGRCIEVQGDIG